MCDIFLSSDTRLVRFLANGAQITRATREIIWTVNLQFVLRERGREGGRGNGGTEEPRSLAPHLAKSDLFNPSLDFPMQASPFPSAPSPLAPLANCFTALFNHLLRRERLALNFRAFLFRETREHHPRAPPRPPLCHPSVVIVVAKSVPLATATSSRHAVDAAMSRLNAPDSVRRVLSRCPVSHRPIDCRAIIFQKFKVRGRRQTPAIANYCRSADAARCR